MYDANTFSKYTRITAEQERETMEKIREGSGRTDLLEQLSARMGCQYLSDLRGTKRKVQCRAVLVEIPAEEYTTETWNDAIYYITGERRNTPHRQRPKRIDYAA